jgi:CRISPR-associated endonuclease/helicase Cas3
MYKFWGKTDKDDIHLLVYHSLDVAATAKVWLEHNHSVVKLISEKLGVGNNQTINIVSFLAGIHDIGKFSSGFQTKVKAAVDKLGTPVKDVIYSRPFSHGAYGIKWLSDAFDDEKLGLGIDFSILERKQKRVIKKLLFAVGVHHGRYFAAGELLNDEYYQEDNADIQIARINFIDAVTDILKPNFNINVEYIRPAIIAIASVISVSDWIGSNKEYFNYESNCIDLKRYFNNSLAKAKTALKDSGLLEICNGSLSSREQVFDFDLRPVQKALNNIDVQSKMIIIEAPTGEGKTEAAYLRLLEHLKSGDINGAYFALPTRATANALYERTHEFLGSIYSKGKVSFELAHSSSWLNQTYEQLINKNTGDNKDNYFEQEASVVSYEWFRSPKRTLLSSYGVGTVDQAMTSALSVRHFFVRLFGLIKGAVIFDEIHAYDTYMDTIICRLLEWLGVFNVPVILLSATLPLNKKVSFIKSYTGKETVELSSDAYPLITAISKEKVVEVDNINAAIKREIGLEYYPAEDIKAIAELIIEKIKSGGGVCVILNTVKRCQALYKELKEIVDNHTVIDAFHSAFTLHDRNKVEKKLIGLYGKPVDNQKRPDKAILIATQVVEQSLDLDFDFMVSDIAPIDLLIQRVGRLHRHEGRQRHDKFKTPMLALLLQSENPGFYVYNNSVILRTMLSLEGKSVIKTPEQTRALIESVYPNESKLAERDYNVQIGGQELYYSTETVKKWNNEERKKYKSMTKTATELRIPNPWLNEQMKIKAFAEPDSPKIQSIRAVTRFGDDSKQCILLKLENGILYTTDKTQVADADCKLLIDINNKEHIESLYFGELPVSYSKYKRITEMQDEYIVELSASVKKVLSIVPALRGKDIIIIEEGKAPYYNSTVGLTLE